MLLPVWDYLSLDDQGGHEHVDTSPASSLRSAFTQVRRDWGKTKLSRLKSRGDPPDQVRPDGGWTGLVWLGKGYFESA